MFYFIFNIKSIRKREKIVFVHLHFYFIFDIINGVGKMGHTRRVTAKEVRRYETLATTDNLTGTQVLRRD